LEPFNITFDNPPHLNKKYELENEKAVMKQAEMGE
jgi:hypothetical protein